MIGCLQGKPNYRRKYTKERRKGRSQTDAQTGVAAPGLRIRPYRIAQQSACPDADLAGITVVIRIPEHVINPEQFKDILQPEEGFHEMILTVHVVGVAAHHQVPVQPAEQGYFIREHAIEMMFDMPEAEERLGIAVDIIGSQLVTVHVFAGSGGSVTVEVLEVLDKDLPVGDETADA